MYCSNCGNKVDEDAYVCLNCGVILKKRENKVKSKKNNTFIIFSECKYDEMLTVMEFENYLIGLENV